MTMRISLLSATALAGCTLAPSQLGDLPGVESGGGAATTSDGGATSTTTTPTSTDATSTGGAGESSGSGETGEVGSSSGTDGGDPDSAWEVYCAYVQAHGGKCEPDVDEAPDLAYPGRGYLVHEWGTDTVVVGSDGSMQRGMHHEEEDMPPFVYDRISAGSLPDSTSVIVKMETPVTYFYSDVPRGVAVAVGFPGGVFTQWYPAVLQFAPRIAAPGAVAKLFDYDDPVLNPIFPYADPMCRALYGTIGDGLLDWSAVSVLARGADAPLADAPLDQFSWGHARAVDANLVAVSGVPGAEAPQHERFLFYRGLGNLALPLVITAGEGGALAFTAGEFAAGRLFVIRVDDERGAFVEHPDGATAGQVTPASAPDLASAPPLDVFVAALAERVTEALDGAGLYHDEAAAMVATWSRQWFRTPGLRVLYLAPQAWTDATLPLAIDPAPEATLRVMVIRSEVITPEQEQEDTAMAGLIASPDTAAAGEQHFLALGRFAEPRLRRASALLGDPSYLEPLIATLLHADTRIAVGE